MTTRGHREWLVGLMRDRHVEIPRLRQELSEHTQPGPQQLLEHAEETIRLLREKGARVERAFHLASDAGTSADSDCGCGMCEDARQQMRDYWLKEAENEAR